MKDEELMQKFQAFCENPPADPEEDLDQRDWYDMSIGFFLALGATVAQAHHLAVKARYEHQYWHPL